MREVERNAGFHIPVLDFWLDKLEVRRPRHVVLSPIGETYEVRICHYKRNIRCLCFVGLNLGCQWAQNTHRLVSIRTELNTIKILRSIGSSIPRVEGIYLIFETCRSS
jgi:hypothetical protein